MAIVDGPRLARRRVALLVGPHERGVGFIIPHGVAHEGVHEHIGLVHVAHHALAGRNRARETMFERMPRLLLADGGIDRVRTAVMSVRRIRSGMGRIAIVGAHDVAAGAAGPSVVAGRTVGTQKPHERVVEPRLLAVNNRTGARRAGTWSSLAA